MESGEVGWGVEDFRKDANDMRPLDEAYRLVQGGENKRELEVPWRMQELVEEEVECQARTARVVHSICEEMHHEPRWRAGWAHPALVGVHRLGGREERVADEEERFVGN